MPRRAAPPDFRYVWLKPGPGPLAALLVGGGTAVAAGVMMRALGYPLAVSILGAGASLASLALAKIDWRRRGREVPMAIVPWGILVEPDTQTRVLRWPAVRRIEVDVSHVMRGGTPQVLHSVVTVDTGREILRARGPGAIGLEGLTVNLEAYAEEASRPVALDLDGLEPAGDDATEPVVADLLVRADELCTTGRGAVRLALPPGGYRSVATASAGPETLAVLRSALTGGDDAPADARPLAAILAVLLGARALVPDLLRLVSAPHPIVAAVAKAAALRLGAARNRAGSIDEVAAFLFDDDRAALERWAHA